MTINQFIEQNKPGLRVSINRALGREESKPVSNAECRLWILNDEGLYHWAKGEGVKI